MVSPAQRREAIGHLQSKGLSARKACSTLNLSRRVAQYALRKPAQDQVLMASIQSTSQAHPRFGYRRVAVWLNLGQKRVWRLWRLYQLALPRRRARRRRVGHEMRIPSPVRPNRVWTYDFLEDRLAGGQRLKVLTVLDECTRECLTIEVGRWFRSLDVINTLARLMKLHGKPEYIRSDNGSEFTASAVMRWLRDQQVGPTYIDPGKPWQNGIVESFHGKFRDECLNREWFVNRREAKIVIEDWRHFYNTQRPHSALGYKTPVAMAAQMNM